MRNGFVFSLDALIAVSILLLFTFFIAGISFSFYSPGLEYERLYYTGKDALTVLEELKVGDARGFDSVEYCISQGVITQRDIDKNLLEVIGALWVSGNTTLQEYAKNITKDVLGKIIPEKAGYELLIDGLSVYKKNASVKNYLSRVHTLISGYQLGKPVTGYVARAWATKIKKNTTSVFPFFIEGAGNEGGKLEIWKKFFLNATNIINATLYISVHYGLSADEFENLFVNGINVKNRINWIYQERAFTGTAAFGIADVTDTIQQGNNTIYLRFKNTVYNAHIHPGMRLEVTYQTNEIKNVTKIEKQRIYFDHIVSNELGNRKSGAWALVPFYIPKGAVIRSVIAHIRAEGIEDVSDRKDVRIYFNDTLYTKFDPPPDGVVDVTYNFTNLTSEGTNWVLVQLNYRISTSWFGEYDDFTGEDETIIYSDPLADPEGSSYVEVEYELPENRLRYGYVDITLSENIGGVPDNPKYYTINFENNTLEKTFVHVAQLFSNKVNISVQPESGDETLVFYTPVARAIPSSIYVDPYYFNTSVNNTIEFQDECGGCEILPESSFEYSIWIPSSVGYGDVYKTEEEAVEDAVTRLNETLGKYAVATNIETEVNSVSGVPTLWGPATIELRVWI